MDGKDNKIESNNFINVSGNLLDLSKKQVMGIINVNNDSFYDGSRRTSVEQAVKAVEVQIEQGADIIDLGAISTRPNADLESTEVEVSRLLPVLKEVRRLFPDLIISVDTFRSDVADQAIGEGADIINDVYGGRYDGQMFSLIAKHKVPYILMHSRGFSQDMMELTSYQNVVNDVIHELSNSISELRDLGVKDIIIDPGFGFAKNIDQNYELLHGLDQFSILDVPVLAGLSRKSMIYKKLDVDPREALNGTTILNTLAVLKGASILRVHDVKQAKEVITLLEN
tara:strand:+ start:12798 stop:13646 length:849 start_codon:yes stop_codon:yes gene_type:complete